MIDTISSLICRNIHPTSPNPAMALPYNNQGTFDEIIHDVIFNELIKPDNNEFHSLNSFVSRTVA
jgi:hypothetical protein